MPATRSNTRREGSGAGATLRASNESLASAEYQHQLLRLFLPSFGPFTFHLSHFILHEVEGRLEHVDREYIRTHIAEAWGWPVITVVRPYTEADPLHGLVWRDERGEIQGLITWFIDEDWAEIVTLDAYQQGRHIGGRLVDGALAELRERGVKRVSVTTTNDNLRAVSFYVRRGFRLVKLDLDGMDRVRAAKPKVPLEGQEGIPLRDMLELERMI